MIITNYGTYLGKPRLLLTRNGETLTVKTFGSIPSNCNVHMCYSTLGAKNRRGHYRRVTRNHAIKNNRGVKAFCIRGAGIPAAANSTYTFTLSKPRKFGRLKNPVGFKVRAELRIADGLVGKRTRYVSNILNVTI